MAPTDEILRERAAGVFPAIIEGADRWSRTLQQLVLGEDVSLDPPPALPDIFREALYFTLHVVDRFAFGQLDEYRRAAFMDGLLNAVASGLQDARVDVETTREAYNELQREYGHFKFPQVGESRFATIEWAFAKRLSQVAGTANPVTVALLPVSAVDYTGVLDAAFSEAGIFL